VGFHILWQYDRSQARSCEGLDLEKAGNILAVVHYNLLIILPKILTEPISHLLKYILSSKKSLVLSCFSPGTLIRKSASESLSPIVNFLTLNFSRAVWRSLEVTGTLGTPDRRCLKSLSNASVTISDPALRPSSYQYLFANFRQIISYCGFPYAST
jgi:hypothetical protein